MSKKKKKRKRKRQTDRGRSLRQTHQENSVVLFEYEITYEAIKTLAYKRLPNSVKNQIKELHYLVYRRPSEAIAPLEELIEKYSHIPVLYNYLSAAYSAIGERDKAEAWVKRSYERHPDYLFAKCNYAEICLKKGEKEKIPIIFDNKLELKLLYPNRKKFHISEIVGFAGTMGWYFFAIGEKETSELYYDLLKQIAPRHPMTRRLKRILHPSLLGRMIRSILRAVIKKDRKRENGETGRRDRNWKGI